MATIGSSLSDWNNLFAPAILQALPNSGSGVLKAETWVDMAGDRVLLNVQHKLADRYEIERRDFSLMGARLRRALLISDDPSLQAKKVRMQRRQLLGRGQDAVSKKPKPLRELS